MTLSYSLPSQLCPQHSDYLTLVQISDLHLMFPPHGKILAGVEPSLIAQQYANNFQKVLAQIAAYPEPIDLLLVTGDLVHDVDPEIYAALYQQLDSLKIPYICLAGNHDVTQELDGELPFEQRRHIAVLSDTRLVRQDHAIDTPYWRLLLCDSAVAGEISGKFSQATLTWLNDELKNAQKPCILFCHHHLLPVQSTWIDVHILQNYTQFWQAITPYRHNLRAIFTGHVHQAHNLIHQGVGVYTVPSTSVQFLPFSADFAIDTASQAGYRWITLYNNAPLATGIKRIDTI